MPFSAPRFEHAASFEFVMIGDVCVRVADGRGSGTAGAGTYWATYTVALSNDRYYSPCI